MSSEATVAREDPVGHEGVEVTQLSSSWKNWLCPDLPGLSECVLVQHTLARSVGCPRAGGRSPSDDARAPLSMALT